VAVAFILIQNNSVVMIAFLNGVKYDLTLLIFVILIVMIAIVLWPITLTLIGLFLLWLFFPEKKLACYNNEVGGTDPKYASLWGNGRSVCDKKFRTKKGQAEHRETCERRRRMLDHIRKEQEERERRCRQESKEREQREQKQREEEEEEDRKWKEYERQYKKQRKKFWEEWDRIYEEFLNGMGEPPNLEKYYKVLGLDTNATLRQIKRRYRELALKYHPDRCTDKKTAEKKFIKIVEAYEMIIRYREDDPEPGEPVMENYPVRSGRV